MFGFSTPNLRIDVNFLISSLGVVATFLFPTSEFFPFSYFQPQSCCPFLISSLNVPFSYFQPQSCYPFIICILKVIVSFLVSSLRVVVSFLFSSLRVIVYFSASKLILSISILSLKVDLYRPFVQPLSWCLSRLPPTSELIPFCTSNLIVDAYIFNLTLRVDNMFFPSLKVVVFATSTSELLFIALQILTLELMSVIQFPASWLLVSLCPP